MPKPVVSTEPSSHPLIPATSPRSQPTDPALSSRSAGRGPQNASESAQGQGQPATAGPHGTTPSADPSNPAPVPPLPWLFQKGNTYGRRRKHHRSRMAKYIQEQTMSESMNVGSWLAVAAGQPFPMERTVRLPRTSEQYAVAVGTATPEQRKIAKKQRRFIVVKEPYCPTVEDMKEAMNWLALRGFGKAPQTVPIESDQTTGLPIMFRKRAPGTDPASQGDGVIDGKAKALPGGVPRRTRPVADPRTRRNPLRDRDSLIPRDITGHHGTTP